MIENNPTAGLQNGEDRYYDFHAKAHGTSQTKCTLHRAWGLLPLQDILSPFRITEGYTAKPQEQGVCFRRKKKNNNLFLALENTTRKMTYEIKKCHVVHFV